jgi:predicted transcriptional regulator
MKANSSRKSKKPSQTVRLSVTLPQNLHDNLESLAEKQDVSLAWVMRKAAEQYVENQNPLFAGQVMGRAAS